MHLREAGGCPSGGTRRCHKHFCCCTKAVQEVSHVSVCKFETAPTNGLPFALPQSLFLRVRVLKRDRRSEEGQARKADIREKVTEKVTLQHTS